MLPKLIIKGAIKLKFLVFACYCEKEPFKLIIFVGTELGCIQSDQPI